MPHQYSHSCCSHPNVPQLTRNRSASVPHSQFSPSRQNPSDPNVVYSNQRKGSIPYNNLPRYPPIQQTVNSNHSPLEEVKTRKTRLPSLPLANKHLMGASSAFGDSYVPLNSIGSTRTMNASTERHDLRITTNPSPRPLGSLPPQSPGSTSYIRQVPPPRHYQTIAPPPPLAPAPCVEPKIVIKQFHLPTSSDQHSRSPTSPSSESVMLCSQLEGLLASSRTLPYRPQASLPHTRRFRSNSAGNIGQASVSLHESFGTTETIGYVHGPTAFIRTDEEYYYQNQIKQPLKRSFSASRVRKLSGGFVKFFKVGCNKNKK